MSQSYFINIFSTATNRALTLLHRAQVHLPNQLSSLNKLSPITNVGIGFVLSTIVMGIALLVFRRLSHETRLPNDRHTPLSPHRIQPTSPQNLEDPPSLTLPISEPPALVPVSPPSDPTPHLSPQNITDLIPLILPISEPPVPVSPPSTSVPHPPPQNLIDLPNSIFPILGPPVLISLNSCLPPEIIDAQSIERAFFYLHTDAMRLSGNGLVTNGPKMRRYLIEKLKTLPLTDLDLEPVQKLLERWEVSARFEVEMQSIQIGNERGEQLFSAHRNLAMTWIELLKAHRQLSVSVGWTAPLAGGHAVVLLLNLEEREGTFYASGRLYNRGGGSESQHSERLGGKDRHIPYLIFKETPLSSLEQSYFLQGMLDLQLLKTRCSTEVLRFASKDETDLTSRDLYEALLPLWPGQITINKGGDSVETVRTPQRSGLCSIKSLITEMNDELSGRVRFFLDYCSFQDYLTIIKISTDNRVHIEEAAERLSRSALKLTQIGVLSELNASILIEMERNLKLELQRHRASSKAQVSTKRIPAVFSRLQCDTTERLFVRFKTYQIIGPPPASSSVTSMNGNEVQLREHINAIQKETEVNPYETRERIFETILEFPYFDDPYWSQMDPQFIANCLTTLSICLRKVAIDDHAQISPRTIGAILKLTAIAIQFAPEEVGRFYMKRFRHHLDHEDGCRHRPSSGCWMQEYTKSATAIRRFTDEKPTDLSEDNFKEGRRTLERKVIKTTDDLDSELSYLDSEALAYFKNLNINTNLASRLCSPFKFFDKSSLIRSLYWTFVFAIKKGNNLQSSAGIKCVPIEFTIKLNQNNEIEKSVVLNDILAFYLSHPGRQYGWSSLYNYNTRGKLNEFITILLERQEIVERLYLPEYLPRTTQNQQLAHRYKVPTGNLSRPLSEFEIQSLLSILISDYLLIPQVVDYFSRHFERLNAPPFCALLETLLFTKEEHGDEFVLIRIGKERPRIQLQLWAFLSRSIHQARALGWIKPSLAILRIQIQVYAAWAYYNIEIARGRDHLIQEVTRFLHDPHPEYRSIICHWIVSAYPYLDQNRDVQLIELCQAAYQEILDSNLSHTWEGMLQKEEEYFLATLKLSQHNQSREKKLVLLPPNVIGQKIFRELYNRNFPAERVGNEWHFVDHQGFHTRALFSGNQFLINRLFPDSKGNLHLYIYTTTPPYMRGKLEADIPCILAVGVLQRNLRFWLAPSSCADDALITTTDNKICYRIIGGNLYRWDGSEAHLRLSNVYKTTLLTYLFRIAPASEWLPWMNDREVVEIELPLYSLSFLIDDQNRWQCTATPGYYLDDRPSIEELEPYSHYLVLCNQKGEQLILMPDLRLKSEQKDLSLKSPVCELTTGRRLFQYRLEKGGKIEHPFDPAASLYLAYLAMEQADYTRSYQIVEMLEREPHEWNPETARILTYFPDAKVDGHPRACAIRLKLAFIESRLTCREIDVEKISRDANIYRNSGSQTFGFRLAPKDATVIESLSFSPAQQTIPPKNRDVKWITPSDEREMVHCSNSPEYPATLVRPGGAFVVNFLVYYKIARHGERTGEAFQQLLLLLRLSRFSLDEKVASLHHILLLVALTPTENLHRFPAANHLIQAARSRRLSTFIQNESAFQADPQLPTEWSLANRLTRINEGRVQISNEPLTPTSVEIFPIEVERIAIAPVDYSLMDPNTEIVRISQILSELEQEIETELHRFPSCTAELEYCGGLLPPIDLQRAIILYGRQEIQRILEHNPFLQPEAIKHIYTLIRTYLINATEKQLLKRMKTSTHPEDELIPRAYQQENPPLLAFEFLCNKRLRVEQLEALNILTGDEDVELEARTGFGKSTIVIPLWLLLTSSTSQGAMMIVPTALFEDQLTHLRKTLGRRFDLLIRPIRFNRERSNDLRYLKQLLQDIQEGRSKRQILLSEIHSFHALTSLKLKELLSAEKSHFQTEYAKIMLQIRLELKRETAIFFDESPICFDIGISHEYAIGSREPLSWPAIMHSAQLYEELILSPEITEEWNFDFLPQLSLKTGQHPEEQNSETIILTLARKIAQKYFNCTTEDLLEGIVPDINPDQKAAFKIFHKQLTVHLNRTITRRYGERYAFMNDRGNRLAFPCRKSRPLPRGQFVKDLDWINFTLQANLRTPLSIGDVSNFITHLRIAVMKNNEGLHKHESRTLIEFYERISKQIALPPLNALRTIGEKIETEILEYLNHNLIDKLWFSAVFMANEATNYRRKVSSSSHKAARVAFKARAASGTTNPDTMPNRFKTQYDPTATANTEAALLESECIILKPQSGSAEEIAERRWVDFLQNTKYRAMIDVASLFRDLSIDKIAEILFAQNQEMKGICFHDENDQLMVIEKGHSKPIPHKASTLEKCDLFYFYRQDKTVGSDIDLPIPLYGAATITFGTRKDEAHQGLGRMRQLGKGHCAGLVVTAEDSQAIARQLEVETLTPLAINNHIQKTQETSKKIENGTNLALILDDLIEEYFWRYAETREDLIHEVYQLFQRMKEFMIEETDENEGETFIVKARDIPIQEAVQAMKAGFAYKWENFAKINPEFCEIVNLGVLFRDFDARIDYNKLPSTLSMAQCEAEIADLDVDAASDLSTAATNVSQSDQLEERNQINETVELPPITFKPAPPIPWDGKYEQLMILSGREFNLMGITCRHAAPNFERISEDGTKGGILRKPACQFFLVHDLATGHLTYVPLDIIDAESVLIQMNKEKTPNAHFDYHFFSGTTLLAFDGYGPPIVVEENALLNVIQKIYRGELSLTTQELKQLHDRFERKPIEKSEFIQFLEEIGCAWPHTANLLNQFKSTELQTASAASSSGASTYNRQETSSSSSSSSSSSATSYQ